MKKFLVVLMALVLTMAMFCANAEVATLAFTYVTDAEGNLIEGDFSAYEAATMTIDDEAMTMIFNDGANEYNYTLEIAEQTDEALALIATKDDGSEQVALYYAVDEDGVKYITLIADENVLIMFTNAAA